jgi:hypothetical protein
LKNTLISSLASKHSHRGTMSTIVLRWNAQFLHFLGFSCIFCILILSWCFLRICRLFFRFGPVLVNLLIIILPKILQKIQSSCIVIRHTLSMLKEKSVNHEVHRRGRVHNHLRSNNLSRLKSNHLRHLKNWHLRSIWQNFLSIFDDFTSLRCFNHEFKTN